MKKLKLDAEALQVDTFEVPTPRGGARGTIVAAEAGMTLPPYCMTFTCGDSHIRPCLAD